MKSQNALTLAIDCLSKIDTDQFSPAVDLLAQASGRVICTGVGKSGHIARKTAATIASIARPCHFVHATEASHGDLGCVSSGDVTIAFSHSGNTAELTGILDHCKWLGVKIIAISANPEGNLAQTADCAIIYPLIAEAFANAPTTSTTAQIVIGDSLAVMLAEKLGKRAEDFHVNHPGGSIGANQRN